MSDPIGSDTAYARLRRDVGDPDMPDAEAEEYLVEAQERYPGNTAKMLAYARVIALRGILIDAAKMGRYVQNQSEIDLREVYKNLRQSIKDWEAEVVAVTDAVTAPSAFFFGVAQGQRGR